MTVKTIDISIRTEHTLFGDREIVTTAKERSLLRKKYHNNPFVNLIETHPISASDDSADVTWIDEFEGYEEII